MRHLINNIKSVIVLFLINVGHYVGIALHYAKPHKKIIFNNFNGKGYGENPKYICNEILRQQLPFKLIWLIQDKPYPDMPNQVKQIRFKSVSAIWHLSTSDVIITNVKNWLPFKKASWQCLIQVWHGIFGVKWVERNAIDTLSPGYVAQSIQNSKITDYFISGNSLATEDIKTAYWYDGPILDIGLPRDDIYFSHNHQDVLRIKQKFGLSETDRIILYAPTFRDDQSTDIFKIDTNGILDAIKKRYKGSDLEEKKREEKKREDNWCILVRLHPNVSSKRHELFNFSEHVIDATDYPDVQELLIASDLLITDYSSMMFDFFILKRPVFLYTPDLDKYPRLRPIFWNLPATYSRDMSQLLQQISCFDEHSYDDLLNKFFKQFQGFDDGHASERMVEHIVRVTNHKS